MKLSGDRVEQIFISCLFEDGEPQDQMVIAEGIINTAGFHPGRLASHAQEISELLRELPDSFQRTGGGGMSFLNACDDKHGNQWTGLHERMGQLFQLGIGCGFVTSVLPREMWSHFPGGMPYYVVDVEQVAATEVLKALEARNVR